MTLEIIKQWLENRSEDEKLAIILFHRLLVSESSEASKLYDRLLEEWKLEVTESAKKHTCEESEVLAKGILIGMMQEAA